MKERPAEPIQSTAITEDLPKTHGKKIKGSAAEHTDMYYIYLDLTHGMRAVLSSESPIYVQVEKEH